MLLRQVGRAELGTYEIDIEARPDGIAAPTTREERTVDPTADLPLVWQLYGMLEDIRIGAELRRRYPGARRALDLLDGDELRLLPEPRPAATPRELALDALLRCALGSADADGVARLAARLRGRGRRRRCRRPSPGSSPP